MVFLLIQLCTAVLSIAVLIAAMRFWRTPRARYFILLCLAISLYAIGYLFELDSHSLEAAFISERIQYLGIPFIGPLFYLFIRDYTRRAFSGVWKTVALFVLPLLTLIFANAYPDSTLYFADLAFVAEPTPHLLVARGPFFWVDIAYSYGLIFLGGIEIIRHFPRRNERESGQVTMFLLATILPIFAIVLLVIGRTPVPMDFGSSALAVSAVILLYYVISRRLQDWLPYVRDKVVERMRDGFVLVDDRNCHVDANKVAKEYFPALNNLAAGTSMDRVRGFPRDLPTNQQSQADYTIREGGWQRVLRVSVTHITQSAGVKYTCVMFYDVSELHKLMGELEHMAMRDGLTGLLNRSAFFRFAERDFELAQRAEQDVALLMLDIDFFKNVNDYHGHQCGDAVLCQVADILQERLRRTDICGRYGGEEFCILLPGANTEAATMVAEIIRRNVSAHPFACEGKEGVFHITVSIGIAQLVPGQHTDFDAMIKDADDALYAAKHGGRNKVVVCDTEIKARSLANDR